MPVSKIVQAPRECPGPEVCEPVRSSPHGWHLKREIQLGHLLTTIGMLASVAVYVAKMDQRVAIVETQLAAHARAQAERDERQDTAAAASDALIRTQLTQIDQKLDRLIERQIRAK